MSIKEQIETDLKEAMLAGDKVLVTTLRGLKSSILYAEVAKGSREQGGLTDAEIVDLFGKEAKKRQESAELFEKGGNNEKAEAEKAEKLQIEKYLPVQLTEAELIKLIDEAIVELNAAGPQSMGQVIGLVKQRSAGKADGSRIAELAKARLNQ